MLAKKKRTHHKRIHQSYQLRLLSLAMLLSTSQLICTPSSVAQSESSSQDQSTITSTQNITAQGIANEIDKKNRGPKFNVGVIARPERTSLLVSGQVPNKEYRKFPIRYQFFINRQLFATQLDSPELPAAAIGVDIGPDIASIPFSYSIVAEVLHPNRRFSSIAHGAVTEFDIITPTPTPAAATPPTSLTANLESCQVIFTDSEDNETIYTATDVSITQNGSELTTSFNASNSADQSIQVNLTLSSTQTQMETDVSGTIETNGSDSSTTSNSASGSVDYTSDLDDIIGLEIGSDSMPAIDVTCGLTTDMQIEQLVQAVSN